MGDFIFYSVLVSKAAKYSFTTAFICIIVVLAGMGGTLVLLGVYKKGEIRQGTKDGWSEATSKALYSVPA